MFGCDKNDDNGKDEEYPVDCTMPPSLIDFMESMGYPHTILPSYTAGEKIGCGGLIITNPDNEIIAFDAACPVEWTRTIILRTYDISSFIVECEVCGNRFLLKEGGVSENNKSLKMKKYKVNGNRVTN